MGTKHYEVKWFTKCSQDYASDDGYDTGIMLSFLWPPGADQPAVTIG